MTPYFGEFILAALAVFGAILIVYEAWLQRQWLWFSFGLVFILAPFWFSMAAFRVVAWADPDWLFNRTISFMVRVPLVVMLYIIAIQLRRRRRNGS